MKTYKALVALAAAVLGVSVQSGRADTVAYSTNDTLGNQTFGGNLGLDFNVLSPILVTAVGAYDSGGDGIAPSINVGIFSRLPGGNPDTDFTGSIVAGTTAMISGNTDPLISGYRFVTLTTPVYLAPGFYTIDAVGFGQPNPNGNENIAGFTITTDTGGSLVNFVGTGRFDQNAFFDYPTLSSADQGFPGLTSHPFAGGSFEFVAAPLPWSASGGLVLLGVVGFMKMRVSKLQV